MRGSCRLNALKDGDTTFEFLRSWTMFGGSNFIAWSLRLKKENTVERTDHIIIEIKFGSLVIIRIQGVGSSKIYHNGAYFTCPSYFEWALFDNTISYENNFDMCRLLTSFYLDKSKSWVHVAHKLLKTGVQSYTYRQKCHQNLMTASCRGMFDAF